MGRAFKDHMLDHMRHAGQSPVFINRTDANPSLQRQPRPSAIFLKKYAQAVREDFRGEVFQMAVVTSVSVDAMPGTARILPTTTLVIVGRSGASISATRSHRPNTADR